jgi:hypothetical protein
MRCIDGLTVGIVAGCGIGDVGLHYCKGQDIFLFPVSSRPIQRPRHWFPGTGSLEVRWPEHEADHSPPSSAEVKNEWSYTPTPPLCLQGMHRDNFTVTICLVVRSVVFTGMYSEVLRECCD